jgi:hypothetical protein
MDPHLARTGSIALIPIGVGRMAADGSLTCSSRRCGVTVAERRPPGQNQDRRDRR